MTRTIRIALLAVAAVSPLAAQQTFTGRVSDSACGGSHRAKAAPAGLTDRQCVAACIKALEKYTIVLEADQGVVPIVNQDAMGLPFYAGRLVKLIAERTRDGLVVSKIEPAGAPDKP